MWRTPASRVGARRPRRPRSRVAATQVRCAAGFSGVSARMRGDGRVGALAGRAAGAVGDRDEGRRRAAPAARSSCHSVCSISSVFGGKNSNETRRPASRAEEPARPRCGGRPSRHLPARAPPAIAMRRSWASHSVTVSLSSPPPPAAGRRALSRARPGASIHWRIAVVREAEAAMGMALAQELEIVRREIDDQQAAAGPEHPRRLGDRPLGIVEIVQHLVDRDHVEGVARRTAGGRCRRGAPARWRCRRGRDWRGRPPACRSRRRCRRRGA